MTESIPTQASFKLDSFRISEYGFKEPYETAPVGLKLDISGEYYEETKKFIVSFNCSVYEKDENGTPTNEFISVKMIANFTFSPDVTFDTIPAYFYKNSIAIIFPYMRAFITTMTLQANQKKPLILPLMNLSSLEKTFISSTKNIS